MIRETHEPTPANVPVPDALEPQTHRGRHRVFLVEVPRDFQPQREWEIPERFAFASLLAGRATKNEGVAITRDFNRQQLSAGVADGRWAVLVLSPEPKRVVNRDLLRENETL